MGTENRTNAAPRVIAQRGEISIHHNYRQDDHGHAHAHVTGGGGETRIGQNGKPVAGDPELTPQQRRVVRENKSAIPRAIGKIGQWLDYRAQQ